MRDWLRVGDRHVRELKLRPSIVDVANPVDYGDFHSQLHLFVKKSRFGMRNDGAQLICWPLRLPKGQLLEVETITRGEGMRSLAQVSVGVFPRSPPCPRHANQRWKSWKIA